MSHLAWSADGWGKSTYSEVNIDLNVGGMLIGLVVCTTLFGMALLQTYVYFTTSRRDGLLLRSVVMLICTLNATSAAVSVQSVYEIVTRSLAHKDVLTNSTWQFQAGGTVKTSLILFIHGVYLLHIYKLLRERTQRRTLLISFLLFVELLSLTSGGLYLSSALRIRTVEDYFWQRTKYLAGISSALIATVNTIIALTMSITLRSSRTGIRRTDRVLVKLYVYFHLTGILMSVMSIANAALYLALPNTLDYLAMDFSITQVYTLSLLILLNTRGYLRRQMNEPVEVNLSAFARGSRRARQMQCHRNDEGLGFGFALGIGMAVGARDEDMREVEGRSSGEKTTTILFSRSVSLVGAESLFHEEDDEERTMPGHSCSGEDVYKSSQSRGSLPLTPSCSRLGEVAGSRSVEPTDGGTPIEYELSPEGALALAPALPQSPLHAYTRPDPPRGDGNGHGLEHRRPRIYSLLDSDRPLENLHSSSRSEHIPPLGLHSRAMDIPSPSP